MNRKCLNSTKSKIFKDKNLCDLNVEKTNVFPEEQKSDYNKELICPPRCVLASTDQSCNFEQHICLYSTPLHGYSVFKSKDVNSEQTKNFRIPYY